MNIYMPIRLPNVVILFYSCKSMQIEREMAQWLERGALPMSLPPCGFESRLVQDFQRNIMFLPSQYWDIGFNVVSLIGQGT